jgi:hypothetical protein
VPIVEYALLLKWKKNISWFIVENKEDFIVENKEYFIVENKEDLLIYLRLK